MKGVKVKDLHKALTEQILKGNGDNYILISDDDEGNGYHTLYYMIEDNRETIKQCDEYGLFHDEHNPDDVVLLG